MASEPYFSLYKIHPTKPVQHSFVLMNPRWRMDALMLLADITGFAFAGLVLFAANWCFKLFVFQWSDLRYLFIPVACLLMFSSTGLYPGIGINPSDEVRFVFIYTAVSFLISFFFVELVELKWRLNILAFFPLGLFSVFFILLMRGLMRTIAVKTGFWGEPVAVLARGKQVDELTQYFAQRLHLGYIPVLAITDSKGRKSNNSLLPVIDLRRFLADARHPMLKDVGTVLVDASFFGHKLRNNSYAKLLAIFPNIIFVSDMTWLEGASLRMHDFEGLAGIKAQRNLLNPLHSIIKRAIDIVGSSIGMFLFSPFMLALIIMVKLDSSGHVFYSQPRIGKGGKIIRIYKFRTMVMNADQILDDYLKANPEAYSEWHKTQKLRNDPRITRVGKWLRKFSIDEIPQLLNVLKGEMSLVGPRPLPAYHYKLLSADANFLRGSVTPGITGLWQVSGRSNVGVREMERLDSYYVHNWSLWLDFYILIRTIWVVLSREGAY